MKIKTLGAMLLTAMLISSPMLMAEDGVTDNSILLGQSCALKGPAQGLGQGMSIGLKTYFEKINADGGVNGRKIELKSLNDGYEPDRCKTTTEMLVQRLKVFALIGEVGTPTSKVAVPIAEEAKVPFIGPFTGAEFLRNPYNHYVVNYRGSYYQEMEKLAVHFVDGMGVKKVACFYQNDGYGKAGLSGIEIALEKRGLKLVATGTYERNSVAVAEGLAQIAASEPEVVIMVGAYKPCAAFITAAKADSKLANAYFCNISFVGTDNLVAELGDAGNEKCVISQVVPYPWDTNIPVVAEYQQVMKAAGQEAHIGFISLEGFLVAKMFCQAVAKVDGELTREKLLGVFNQTFDLGGIVLKFGDQDHQGMDDIFLTRIENGKAVPITQQISAVKP